MRPHLWLVTGQRQGTVRFSSVIWYCVMFKKTVLIFQECLLKYLQVGGVLLGFASKSPCLRGEAQTPQAWGACSERISGDTWS